MCFNAGCQLHVYTSLYPAKEPTVDTIIEENVTCSQSWSWLDNQQDSAALALLLVESVVSLDHGFIVVGGVVLYSININHYI